MLPGYPKSSTGTNQKQARFSKNIVRKRTVDSSKKEPIKVPADSYITDQHSLPVKSHLSKKSQNYIQYGIYGPW